MKRILPVLLVLSILSFTAAALADTPYDTLQGVWVTETYDTFFVIEVRARYLYAYSFAKSGYTAAARYSYYLTVDPDDANRFMAAYEASNDHPYIKILSVSQDGSLTFDANVFAKK